MAEEYKFTDDPTKAGQDDWIYLPEFDEPRGLTEEEKSKINPEEYEYSVPERDPDEPVFGPPPPEYLKEYINTLYQKKEAAKSKEEKERVQIQIDSVIKKWENNPYDFTIGGGASMLPSAKNVGKVSDVPKAMRAFGPPDKQFDNRFAAMRDRESWSDFVIENQLGGINPFDIEINKEIAKADARLPSLFKHIFRGKVAWADRHKLNKEQRKYWNSVVKQYHADVEDRVINKKNNMIKKYNFFMNKRDNYVNEIEARMGKQEAIAREGRLEERALRREERSEERQIAGEERRRRLWIFNPDLNRKMQILESDWEKDKEELEKQGWQRGQPISTRGGASDKSIMTRITTLERMKYQIQNKGQLPEALIAKAKEQGLDLSKDKGKQEVLNQIELELNYLKNLLGESGTGAPVEKTKPVTGGNKAPIGTKRRTPDGTIEQKMEDGTWQPIEQ